MLMGARAAAIVTVVWFLISVIKWDFAVSAPGCVAYIAEKWFT
jgi:hypothetical protein